MPCRRIGWVVAGLLVIAAVAGCSVADSPARVRSVTYRPQRIIAAPGYLLGAGEPSPNGTMWTLAGAPASRGLFEFDLSSGREVGSLSVSNAAQSVAESLVGEIGVALGTRSAGALEFLDSGTGAVVRTVPLGAPARDVVVGSDGSTFYVLNGTATSTSVTIVNARNGRVHGTVAVPLDTVSIVPDPQQSTLYALEPDGKIDQIAVAGGKIVSSFRVGDSGRSLALSPDGTTLYVLKGDASDRNVAVVDVATQGVQKVLSAPADALQVLVSANGSQLYQVVGTARYGNIQVFTA